MKKLLLATVLVALVTSPCLAGSPWCVAKNTAKMYDVPNETHGKLLMTITKKDGDVVIPIDYVDSALKGWHYVVTDIIPTGETGVSGYVKADAVHCGFGPLPN